MNIKRPTPRRSNAMDTQPPARSAPTRPVSYPRFRHTKGGRQISFDDGVNWWPAAERGTSDHNCVDGYEIRATPANNVSCFGPPISDSKALERLTQALGRPCSVICFQEARLGEPGDFMVTVTRPGKKGLAYDGTFRGPSVRSTIEEAVRYYLHRDGFAKDRTKRFPPQTKHALTLLSAAINSSPIERCDHPSLRDESPFRSTWQESVDRRLVHLEEQAAAERLASPERALTKEGRPFPYLVRLSDVGRYLRPFTVVRPICSPLFRLGEEEIEWSVTVPTKAPGRVAARPARAQDKARTVGAKKPK